MHLKQPWHTALIVYLTTGSLEEAYKVASMTGKAPAVAYFNKNLQRLAKVFPTIQDYIASMPEEEKKETP
jgi:hypothetical protein